MSDDEQLADEWAQALDEAGGDAAVAAEPQTAVATTPAR